MKRRAVAAAFAATLLGTYLLLGVPALLLLPHDDPFRWLWLAMLHECLVLGIAVELSELLFGWLLAARVHPRAAALDRTSLRVAVLYLCCDDIDEESLAALQHLRDVDVFVLDDSRTEVCREIADRSGLPVVRRAKRTAFKAGNLNHWLRAYGVRYDYFVVLDNDSIMTTDSIWELVAYAEAAENRRVAIVQSTIVPRSGNRFQHYISIQAALRNRILGRLYDAIGWTLSHGHNVLHRTAAIRAINGFDTSASCEDTATSLRLLRHGWRIILVPTVSYDAEPRNILAFRRRYIRWARQTVDVVKAMDLDADVSCAILMARHLLGYLLPIAGTVSLAAFLAGSASMRLAPGIPTLAPAATRIAGTIVAMGLAATLSTLMLLRIALCMSSGQRLRTILLATLLNGAAIAFCTVYAAAGILTSLVRAQVRFTPTGATETAAPTLARLWYAMAAAWIAYTVVAALSLRKPLMDMGALQLFWTTCFVGAPPLLWLFHRDQRREAA